MWKRKIHSPLYVILRRSLRSSSSSRLSVASTCGLSVTSSFGSLCGEEEKNSSSRFRRFHFLIQNQSLSSQSVQRVADRCWNCSWVAQTAPFLACDNCRTVQPVDPSIDYFQIFGLERKYDIEEENLEGKYKDWQKKLHPDLVHSKSEREKEYAAEQSARVIDAYHTLGNPLARAVYIMKLKGVDWDEEQTISEPELLAEIMEIREAVEEATNFQALNQIQVQIQEKLKCWSEYFATAFRSQKYEEACASILRMTYYMRINEEIVKKL